MNNKRKMKKKKEGKLQERQEGPPEPLARWNRPGWPPLGELLISDK
jgi:hypothetical protein